MIDLISGTIVHEDDDFVVVLVGGVGVRVYLTRAARQNADGKHITSAYPFSRP